MRILILRALKLGDFLTGMPAYRALRRAYPDAEIVLAAPRALEPLRELTGGAIDRIADAHALEPLARELHGADLGVNLHGSGPQSHRILLAARRTPLHRVSPRRRPGKRGRRARSTRTSTRSRAGAGCCAHAGIAADPHELDLAVPPVLVPRRIRGATLMHPGAASEARRWPVERWIEVARAEQRLGRTVIVTGGPDEVERARTVASAAGVPSTHVYAGRTNLRELAALVAAAGRVVCGDTGVAHLASAYRTPSVVLFGPIAPASWGPPQRPYHRVLWNGTTGDPHANRVDPGLLAIKPGTRDRRTRRTRRVSALRDFLFDLFFARPRRARSCRARGRVRGGGGLRPRRPASTSPRSGLRSARRRSSRSGARTSAGSARRRTRARACRRGTSTPLGCASVPPARSAAV